MVSTERKRNIIKFTIVGVIGLAVTISAAVLVAFTAPKDVPTSIPNNTANISKNNEVVEVSNKVTYTLPMNNASIAKDYSSTELQYNETLKQWQIHKAIDFLAGDDLNVFSISSGTVSNVYNNYLEGNVVEITHANGLVSVYKSMGEVVVKAGDNVTTGQLLGVAGVSMAEEQNSGAHLHFELYENGKKIDPANYLDLGVK